jgi:hypothetical protein
LESEAGEFHPSNPLWIGIESFSRGFILIANPSKKVTKKWES